MSDLLLWNQGGTGGGKALVLNTFVASDAIPWGGRAAAGLKQSTRLSLELHGVVNGATYAVKLSRKPLISPDDAAMGAVDLSTTSHLEGNAGAVPQPIDVHTYAANFEDLVEVDLSDAPANLYVYVKATVAIGAGSLVRAYLRWL